MNYPIIKDSSDNTLAILNNTINPKIKEKINGEYTFKFTAIIEELKTDYIHYNNFIEVDNNLFQIVKYTKKHTLDNKLLVAVLCEHVSYKLIENILDSFILENETPVVALSTALTNTGFNMDTCEVGGVDNIKLEDKTNVRAVLNEIAKTHGGEYRLFKYNVSLLAQRGQNRGVQFRIGKNLKGIEKTVDNTKKDSEGNPYVNYKIKALELNNLDDFKGLEGIELGDTAGVHDEDLGINILARIYEIEKDPVNKRVVNVALGNFIENITDYNLELRKTSNLVTSRSAVWDRADIITPERTLYTQYLEGEIDTLNNSVKAGLGTVKITDNNGILITDQPTETASTKALRLLGGVLAISNEKDINDNWIWRTFGTGDGFTADEIISGKILASLIDAETITVGMLEQTLQADIAKGVIAEQNAKNYADTIASDLQNQIDGNITTWFYDGEPTLFNNPAVNWTDDTEKDRHLGDLYYDNLTDYGYRFKKVDSGYIWDIVKDTDVVKALADAQTAQNTADSKIVTYYQDTTPAADGIGDLWVDLSDSNKLYRWNGAIWEDISDASTVKKETLYNRVKFTSSDGVQVLDASNNERLKMGAIGVDQYGFLTRDASGNIKAQVRDDGSVQLINGEFVVSDGTKDRIFVGIVDGQYKLKIVNADGDTIFDVDDANGVIDIKYKDGIFDGVSNDMLYLNWIFKR